ncbi:MAG: UDP-N-acetylglucosamine--N-acetylmuramyl-(pentapeptide) pyrophosphoryl-undecaprenol N-acetylglucosamine transferase [Planctomycetes bacterium]|nr:UDP-N-acetylglucosamine--N-acetylmuramyl-(pentapeptide) pyrophosphoryl-undecaprenol N-acetylglucosamine transferase [Planctomycetota bacterium]
MARADEALRRIAFFGGGTGGHLTPGVAVAERARDRFPGLEAVFFCTRRPVEKLILEGAGFSLSSLDLAVPRGARGWMRFALGLPRAARQVRAVLRRGCDAGIGLGGYASLPGIIAARREGVPVVLLEQNRIPGRVNRLLSGLVSAVSCPFPQVADALRGRREVTGNPVRRSVREAAAQRRGRARGPGGRRRVLVVGGSQGARGLNGALMGALPALSQFREKIEWIHVSGSADKEAMEECYRQGGWEALVMSYSSDLPRWMADSDLVIARAGGTTLAELTVLGVPAVLVPYPHHADRHQLHNARTLVEAGGAVLLDELELGASSLERVFREILFSPERLRCMEQAALSLGRPEAADAVINLLLEVRRPCRQDSGFSS